MGVNAVHWLPFRVDRVQYSNFIIAGQWSLFRAFLNTKFNSNENKLEINYRSKRAQIELH